RFNSASGKERISFTTSKLPYMEATISGVLCSTTILLTNLWRLYQRPTWLIQDTTERWCLKPSTSLSAANSSKAENECSHSDSASFMGFSKESLSVSIFLKRPHMLLKAFEQ